MSQIDDVTQQDSALVEENAATAKTLEYQAKSMDEEVAYFQIEADITSEAPEPCGIRTGSLGPVKMPGARSLKGRPLAA